jgi:hypothetical protein
MINRRDPFWRDVFRDVLRELVRKEGARIVEAPRFAQLAASMADEAMKQTEMGEGACVLCNGARHVIRSGVEDTCGHCNGTGVEPAPVDGARELAPVGWEG